MSIDRLFVADLEVLDAPLAVDGYGDQAPDWSAATRRRVRGWIDQQARQEVRDGAAREAEVSSWIVYLPAGDPITASSRVVYDGATFEVDGQPNRARTPRGPHHVEASLRLVEG